MLLKFYFSTNFPHLGILLNCTYKYCLLNKPKTQYSTYNLNSHNNPQLNLNQVNYQAQVFTPYFNKKTQFFHQFSKLFTTKSQVSDLSIFKPNYSPTFKLPKNQLQIHNRTRLLVHLRHRIKRNLNLLNIMNLFPAKILPAMKIKPILPLRKLRFHNSDLPNLVSLFQHRNHHYIVPQHKLLIIFIQTHILRKIEEKRLNNCPNKIDPAVFLVLSPLKENCVIIMRQRISKLQRFSTRIQHKRITRKLIRLLPDRFKIKMVSRKRVQGPHLHPSRTKLSCRILRKSLS